MLEEATTYVKNKNVRTKNKVTREDCVRSVNTALSAYGLVFQITINQVKLWLGPRKCAQTTVVVAAQDRSVDGRDMTAKPLLPNYIYF